MNVIIYSSSVPMGDGIGIYEAVGFGRENPFFHLFASWEGVKEGLRHAWKTPLRILNDSCLSEHLPSQLERGASFAI